jgi:hypothetical protein
MCTYCTTTNYRAIYENHIGPIPKELNGRTYEIHHIDGNHSNNDLSNLKAVTLQEHYDIHYANGDWYACKLIKLQRMNYTSEELSQLARKNVQKSIDAGSHPFITRIDGSNLSSDRVKVGTHHWQGEKNNKKRVENGTHPFLGGEIQRKVAEERIKTGTHNFFNENHPAKIKLSCVWCKKETSLNVFPRDHSKEKCKKQ